MSSTMEKESKGGVTSPRKDEEEKEKGTEMLNFDTVKIKQERIDDYEEAQASRRRSKSVDERCFFKNSERRYESDVLLRRDVEVVIKREPGLDVSGFNSEQRTCKIVSRKSLSGPVKQSKTDAPVTKNGNMQSSGDEPDPTPADEAEKRLAAKLLPSTSQGSSVSSLPSTSTRLTRSHNPEFLAKQKHFLQKVNANPLNQSGDCDSSVVSDASDSTDTVTSVGASGKRKWEKSIGPGDNGSESSRTSPTPDGFNKKRKNSRGETPVQPILEGTDKYCWTCHREGIVISCITCPRVYHLRCTQLSAPPSEQWVCPECVAVVRAENLDTRSRAMRLLSPGPAV